MERTSYKPGTPNWIDLMTTDVAAAREFYGSLLGWTFEDQTDPESGAVVYTMARLNGYDVAGLGEMGPGMAESGMPPVWNSYVSVASVDETLEKVAAAGGSVIMPPMDVFDSGRMAVVSDPVGAVISAWEPRAHIGATLVNEPGAWCWNELMSADMATSRSFLQQVFGWQASETDTGPMVYTGFALADAKPGDNIAGGMAPPMPGIPNCWTIYFAVTDCDATVAAAEASGAAVLAPPMDISHGRMAVLSDPQGAVFNVINLTVVPPGE